MRRFQSAAERESEGRKKGYSGTLEADLWRSEAKIEALANPSNGATMTYRRGERGDIVAEEKDEVPRNKEDGLERWRKEMELMFLRGGDGDFDYAVVDQGEEYDDRGVEEREEEEKWFEEEEPSWAAALEAEEAGEMEEIDLNGQTGVLDY